MNQPGWKGFNDDLYTMNDPRLLGSGSPPSDPIWQIANPGSGRAVMRQVVIEVAKNGSITEVH